MDRQSVYTLSLFGESQNDNGDTTFKQIQKELVSFIMEFHLENAFIYRYAPPWTPSIRRAFADDGAAIRSGRTSFRNSITATSISLTSSPSTKILHIDSTTSRPR
nr:hypothetical protein CFP56_30036 [Quercus suber]